MGWLGSRLEVFEMLSKASADRCEKGFYVRHGICYGLDPTEMLLSDTAEYRLKGEWKSLTKMMEESGYGVKVHVIGCDI